jgi:Exopolysaccharide biosynthesis protein YbjH
MRRLPLAVAVLGLGAAGQAQPVADVTPTLPPTLVPPTAPSLNFYGSSGLLDMPSAEMLPDAQFATSYSYFGGQSRYNLTFQALPWLSASFRYNGIQNLNLYGFSTYYDRSFDVRFRLLSETRSRPALTLGLQDFAGTGIYAGEYIVATKGFETPPLGSSTVPGRLKFSAGLGWGRLGSYGAIGSTGSRPAFSGNSTGGTLSYDQWFRGDFAPFGGVEWLLNDRWGLKAEYSSDAYVTETQTSNVFERKSALNFGAEYQVSPRTRLGAYYLYGSEIGFNAQIQLNPKYPPNAMKVPAPLPILPRSSWAGPGQASASGAWSPSWASDRTATARLRDAMVEALAQDGLILESLELSGTSAEVRFRNPRYRSQTLAVGRAARALSRLMPPSVETFRMVPVRAGMGLSSTVIRRSDLEALEFDANAAEALLAVTSFGAAAPVSDQALLAPDLYPAFSTSVSPYSAPAYFDPDRPFRLDVGIDFGASYEPAPGWIFAASLRQRLAGNVKDGRASNSALPHVRTDQVEYAQYSTTLETLYGARTWKPGPDLYARASLGYFESMYGGVSGELLWKPVASPLALGAEANYVVQRDFDQRLGFRDYKVFTGQASAYYDLGRGYQVQVDAGRYLAGDYGGTFSLDRVFNNGWSVGGFFTLTDVSAEDFGEGSFDKGFRFQIPLDWMLGKPGRNSFGTTVRPVQRDGGQKVFVPGRLYGQIRDAQRARLKEQGARIWE